MEIRAVVAEEHGIARAGICALLARCAEVEIVGRASQGREAVALVEEHQADLAVLSVNLPGLNGLDATRRIVAAVPDCRVLLVSNTAGSELVREAFAARAQGFLLQNGDEQELPQAVTAILRGGVYISPQIAGLLVNGYVGGRAPAGIELGRDRLSPREREVLQLIAEGQTTKEIASVMKISGRTVESHRAQLMSKLAIRTTAGLTKYAIREGLTTIST